MHCKELFYKRCSTTKFFCSCQNPQQKPLYQITDLINYRKHSWKVDKLNGLKLILHSWRKYNESSFKCKVIPWVTAEKVWNKLAAWQLYTAIYKR